jgi:hypothetical protein
MHWHVNCALFRAIELLATNFGPRGRFATSSQFGCLGFTALGPVVPAPGDRRSRGALYCSCSLEEGMIRHSSR